MNLFIHIENENVSYLTKCPCQLHLSTELINRTYTMTVERLFDYIFGDNDFLAAYRTSRRIKGFLLLFLFFFYLFFLFYRRLSYWQVAIKQ